MKLTRKKIRKIIREAISWKNHVDGHPFPGTMEELADMHGKPWGGGEVVDPDGWSDNVNLAGKFTQGKAPSILTKKKKKVSEIAKIKHTKQRLRRIVRETVQNSSPDMEAEARDILQHYSMISYDAGEMYVDDVIDHWVSIGNPEPGPEVRDVIISMNYGSDILG